MKKLQTIERQYLTKFMNYKKFFNMSIEEAYTNIFKKSRKIAIIQFNMIVLTKSERRFQIFLQFLFFEYNVIPDVINVQNNSNIDKFIQKLQKKKIQLKTSETAM